MPGGESGLKLVQASVWRREALDRLDASAICLDGQHQARADGDPVDEYGAGAAYAVLAPQMRSGQTELMPQKIGEMNATFDVTLIAALVDRNDDGMPFRHGPIQIAAPAGALGG